MPLKVTAVAFYKAKNVVLEASDSALEYARDSVLVSQPDYSCFNCVI